jgi:alkylated DNA repair dioxygenase AlkB
MNTEQYTTIIEEFISFANPCETIYTKSTWTGEWISENAILLIWAEYNPRKGMKVNINYHECHDGSTNFKKWLKKYGLRSEWMNPGIMYIYKPTIHNSLIEYNLLPTELSLTNDNFENLWNMIPSEYNYIKMYGKTIQAPRRYKVYGTPYKFTGMTSEEINEVPEILQPYLEYINNLDEYEYNSVLINWYQGSDYIGFHADNTSNLVLGSNIYGISFGQHRTLRFKNGEGKNIDYVLENNSVINMKHGCQEVYKHSILQSKKLVDRRINITFRSVQK